MLKKTIENSVLNVRKMRKVVHKFEIVRLSVSLFQLRFAILSCTLALFGITLVTFREGTDRNLLDFLGYKILRERSPSEFRPVGEHIPYISRHSPRSSEHSIKRRSMNNLVTVACT